MTAAEARAPRGAQLRQWLGNPLVVTVVSAVLVSLVIPQLTRQWQDHQKALEIQTGLVGSMSESSSDAVISGRMLASRLPQGGPAATQRLYNDAVRSWSIQGSVIRAKLEAYFPGTGLGDAWAAYANALGNYLQLSASRDRYRPQLVAAIRVYAPLPRTRPPVDWRVLATQDAGDRFQQSYTLLGFALLDRRDALVRAVLDEHPASF
jgi:hypothetical protein